MKTINFIISGTINLYTIYLAVCIGVNKLKNRHFHFPRNKISLRILPKLFVYFILSFWHS